MIKLEDGNLYPEFKAPINSTSNKVDFTDNLEEHAKTLCEVGNNSEIVKVSMKDAYSNTLLSVGNADESKKFDQYGMSNDTQNWPLWLALYNDSWVFKRAIDKPARDEIRCGINITSSDCSKKEDILKLIRKYRSDMIELLKWGGLFGGAISCVLVEGMKPEDYAKPMDVKKLQGKLIRFYTVDRWYGIQPSYNVLVSDFKDLDYNKPKFYTVTVANSQSIKFHHDWVIRYEHRHAPKLIQNGILQGWGYCEGSHIINEMMRDEKLKASIQSLIDKASIEVIKMAGMRGLFMGTDPANENQIRQRLEMVNWGRNFNSLTFLDKDDDYQEHGFTGLSGLAQLIEQNMWMISAALEMQGVLYGDLTNGMSHDSDVLEKYDDVINGRCEDFVRPVYDKLLKIICGIVGETNIPEYEFGSLLPKKQDEDKMDGLGKFSDLLSKALQDGIITPQLYAKALYNYTNKGIIDFGIDEEYINSLEDTTMNEMENIDLENMGEGKGEQPTNEQSNEEENEDKDNDKDNRQEDKPKQKPNFFNKNKKDK